MKVNWQIDPEDVTKATDFYNHNKENAFVRKRIASNLKADKLPIGKEGFWEVMIGCLLTTQQRSGPSSAVSRFISTKPFPLQHGICEGQESLDLLVTKVLSEFGGLRRSNIIGKAVRKNADYLVNGGWAETNKVLEQMRLDPSPATDREAARFIARHFSGFGPKQSRNLIQGIGLSRFEVPIDSRITKWLSEFGFPLRLNPTALADEGYFEFVSDGFQSLAQACGIVPCVLDAAIFASFDGDGWTEENVVW